MEGIQKKIAVLNDGGDAGYQRPQGTVLSGGDGGAVQSRGISGMLYG